MAELKLSFAMTPYDRMLPLINGEVKPDGITLEYTGMPGSVPLGFRGPTSAPHIIGPSSNPPNY